MVKIPKEDFLGYDAKFNSRSGKDWLLFGLIGWLNMFLRRSSRNIAVRYLPEKTQVSKYKLTQVRRPCFIHYKIAV